MNRARNFDDARRVANDRRQTVPLLKLFLEQQILSTQLAIFATPPQQQKKMIDIDRLLDEVRSAELHRLDRVLDRAECRHHDHGTIGIGLFHLPQNRDSVGTRKAQVRQNREVPPPLGDPA